MNNKLSKREKIMVYIMILVVIGGVGFILIKPLIEKYNAAKTTYEDTKFERQTQELDVKDTTILEEDVKSLQDYCGNNSIALGEPVSASYMEQDVLKYATDCNLLVNSTSITSAYDPYQEMSASGEDTLTEAEGSENTSEQTAGQISDETADQGADGTDQNAGMTLVGEEGDTIDSYAEESAAQTEESVSDTSEDGSQGPLFSTSNLILELKGTYGNFCDFLDAAANEKSMSINSFSVYNESGEVVYQMDGEESYTYYVSVNYYMKNQ